MLAVTEAIPYENHMIYKLDTGCSYFIVEIHCVRPVDLSVDYEKFVSSYGENSLK
jgi:hypothetical protein